MDICRFDGGDCCKKHLIANGVCDEVNNFETCGNFDGGDCKGKFIPLALLLEKNENSENKCYIRVFLT